MSSRLGSGSRLMSARHAWWLLALALLALSAAVLLSPRAAMAAEEPIASYAFDEGSGETAHDSSASHDGALHGAKWTEAGKFGPALEFDGENDLVTVPGAAELELGEAFTLEAWVRPQDSRQFGAILTKEIPEFFSYSLEAGGWEAGVPEGLISPEARIEKGIHAGEELPVNAWSHLALSFDGEQLRLYVNGELVKEAAAAGPQGGEGPLQLGGAPVFSDYFKGVIDEVRVYDRALSAEEVEADEETPIEAVAAGPAPEPVASYAFDEGSGETAHDSSASHDGALHGAKWTEAGKFGPGLEFDGENDLVTVPGAAELELGEAFTLEAWVRPQDSRQFGAILTKEIPEFFSYSLETGGWEAGVPEGLISPEARIEKGIHAGEELPLNAWSHLALSFDGEQLRLYVNGELVKATASAGPQGGEGPLQLGGAPVFSDYFKGLVDEVRVYDQALGPAAINLDRHVPVKALPGTEGSEVTEGGSEEGGSEEGGSGGGASKCTTVWIGPASGEWQEGENWSGESVPGPTDVACIPTGRKVEIAGGSRQVRVLQGKGELAISSGSLALMGILADSNIGRLTMTGGKLTGPGDLHVVTSLDAPNGLLEGEGETFVGVSAEALIEGGGAESGEALRVTDGYGLVVRGKLTLEGASPQLVAKEGASIESTGTLALDGHDSALTVKEDALLANKGTLKLEGEGAGLLVNDSASFENLDSLVASGPEQSVRVDSKAGLFNTGSMRLEGSGAEVRVEGKASLENEEDLLLIGAEARLAASEAAAVENFGTLEAKAADQTIALSDGALLKNTGTVEVAGNHGELIVREGAEVKNEALLGAFEGEIAVTAPNGRIWTDDGAEIANFGRLIIDSEGEGNGIVAGGTGTAPLLVNHGTLLKSAGSGDTPVEIRLDNEHLVKSRSGRLVFDGGGNSGQSATDSWVAAPEGEGSAAIVFAAASFSLGANSVLAGPVELEDEADVKTGQLEGPAAEVDVIGSNLKTTDAEGSSEIGSLSVDSEAVVRLVGETTVNAATLRSGEIELPAGYVADFGLLNQEGGDFEVGDGADITMTTASIGGLMHLGKGVTATSSFYDQSGGKTVVGSEAHLAFVNAFLGEGGILQVGNDCEAEYGNFATESTGIEEATFGEGTKFSATNVFLNSATGVEFGDHASFDVGGLYLTGASLSFGDSAVLDIDTSAYVDNLLVTGADAKIEIEEGLFVDPGAVFLVGAGAEVEAEAAYLDSEQHSSFGTGSEVSFDSAYLEGETALQGSTTAEIGEVFVRGALSGQGTLQVDRLFWNYGSMSGGGSTVVKEGGHIGLGGIVFGEPVPGVMSLDGWTLINHGNLGMDDGRLEMSNRGEVRNYGKLQTNSEDASAEDQIAVGAGSTAAPRIVNWGTLEKTLGEGTTRIASGVDNFGEIRESSGHLEFRNPLMAASSERFSKECTSGEPVNCSSGNFFESQTDLAIGGLGVGLNLTRTYSAQAAVAAGSPGAFGYGWSGSFGDHLVSEEGGEKIVLVQGDGSTVSFSKEGEGTFSPPARSQDTLTGTPEAGYVVTLPEQTEYLFSGTGRLESVTDRNGNETTLAYEGSGRLEAIADPAGRQITFAYNGGGQVESAEDPMGHVVSYGYEGGQLTSVTMPGEAEPRWQFEYDGSHRITNVIDGRGGETINEYDGSNRTISQTDPGGHTLSFEYAPFHTQITNEATGSVTDEWFTSNNEPFSITHGYGTPEAVTEAFAYNFAGQLISRTDGNGHQTTYGYDAEGNRTSEKDAAGNEAKWAYDEDHALISMTTPGGEKTTIERDADGNPESISRPAPGEETQTSSFEYDGNGQLEHVVDPLERVWSYGYDEQGNRTSETDPAGNKATLDYDEDSRLISIVSPRGNVEEGKEAAKYTVKIERDPQGRPEEVIDQLGNATEYSYDDNGNLKARTDANGHTTEYAYSPDDQQTEIKKPNGAVLETAYDGAGAVISQTDANEETTTYVRNALGQPVEVIDPLERKTIEEFDPAGNLKTKIDPAERETSYAYDAADRLQEVSYSDGTTPGVQLEYDPDGNVESMVDGTGESSFEYDQLGRLTRSESGHGDVVAYEYDLAEEQTGIVYPNGKEVARKFDSAGRLESVTDWLGGKTAFAYDPDSNLERITFPAASGNVDSYAYDRTDRMSHATFAKGLESIASLSYTREKVGQIEEEISTGLPGAEKTVYGYDENDRLTSAGAASYEYDPADNLTKAPGTTNKYDPASQLETGTGVSYTFNKLGERTKATPASGPATSYEYDQAGNLISVQRSEEGEVPAIDEGFAYDGTGLMASWSSGPTTQYLSWNGSTALPLLLSDGQNNYIYGSGGLPIEQISEGTPTFYHHDQLGSTRMLTDEGGESIAAFAYSAYGQPAGSTGTQTTPLGYAGQYTNRQGGLIYMRARVYDPVTGQFLTRDPLLTMTRQPYAYIFDNPIGGVDPTGRFAATAAGCAVAEVAEPVGGCVAGAAAATAATAAAAAAGAAAGSLLGGDEELTGTLTVSKGLQAQFAKEKEAQETGEDATCRPSNLPDFNDPSQPPGPGWEWRGNGPPGSREGSWFNPDTNESLHPDLEHGGDIGPHYDYYPGRSMPKYRVFPDGRIAPGS